MPFRYLKDVERVQQDDHRLQSGAPLLGYQPRDDLQSPRQSHGHEQLQIGDEAAKGHVLLVISVLASLTSLCWLDIVAFSWLQKRPMNKKELTIAWPIAFSRRRRRSRTRRRSSRPR